MSGFLDGSKIVHVSGLAAVVIFYTVAFMVPGLILGAIPVIIAKAAITGHDATDLAKGAWLWIWVGFAAVCAIPGSIYYVKTGKHLDL